MPKKIFLVLFLMCCKICNAQNLVPNGDFEDTLACPTFFGTTIDQTLNAPPWHRTTRGTSDYFNQCNDSIVSVPYNFMGYQPSKSGVAYMGMTTAGSYYREYISAPLINPLQAGVIYYASMYISLGCNPSYICPTGADKIGVYFSVGVPDTTGVTNGAIPVVPQIENTNGNLITDTLNWIKISGLFIASGGENYITIGNFRDLTNTNGTGYYYIDDVCVSTDSLTCNSTVGVTEIKTQEELVLFPNPFSDKINITAKRNELVEVTLYDVTSRKILQQKFSNSISLNTSELAKGIYLYEVRNKNGVIKKGKVVKE